MKKGMNMEHMSFIWKSPLIVKAGEVFIPQKTKDLPHVKVAKTLSGKVEEPKSHQVLKVGILDDNAFFNRIVTGRLEAYAKFLSKLHQVNIELHPFTSARQFLEDIKKDYDLVFVDYVLGDNTNGFRVARSLKGYCEKCRIVVFSEFLGPADYMEDTDVYDEWWPKDSKVLDRCCIALDTVLMDKLRV